MEQIYGNCGYTITTYYLKASFKLWFPKKAAKLPIL